VILELRQERLRGLIGVMWVEAMHPEKPLAGLALEPTERARHDGVGLSLPVFLPASGMSLERVVIDVEALVQAELRIQRESADEGARCVAETLEMLGQGQLFLSNVEMGVVVNAVMERVFPEEDRRVRGQGRRRLGEGPAEDDPFFGQAVDRPGLEEWTSIAAEPVRPQSIDGDEQEVGLRRGTPRPEGGGRSLRPAGGQTGEEKNPQGDASPAGKVFCPSTGTSG